MPEQKDDTMLAQLTAWIISESKKSDWDAYKADQERVDAGAKDLAGRLIEEGWVRA